MPPGFAFSSRLLEFLNEFVHRVFTPPPTPPLSSGEGGMLDL